MKTLDHDKLRLPAPPFEIRPEHRERSAWAALWDRLFRPLPDESVAGQRDPEPDEVPA